MNPIEVQVSGGQGIVPATYKTIVLKPNIVNGKNMLTQAMFAQTDTKYVIKYDYIINDDIITESVQVLSSNVSQCVNPDYTEALAAYNEAHDAWIDADNAYTNDPNDTTLAAKNAAYTAYTAAQTTLNNTPQYYYYAAKAINLQKGQYISIPDNCVLLNNSLNGLAGFEIAPNDIIVYIGSLIPGTYEYTVQNAIQIPARCLIEFDGGSISDGVLIGDETILIFDQEEEVVLRNVELLGTFEYSAGGSGGVNKKDNTNGMATITLKGNKGFAEQLTLTNTIYRIMYDFDLNGESVTIPDNCVLQFDGGSLNNGTVVCHNSEICGIPILNVRVNGSIKNIIAYQNWFKDNDIDLWLHFIGNVDGPTTYEFKKGEYNATTYVHKSVDKSITINGNGAKICWQEKDVTIDIVSAKGVFYLSPKNMNFSTVNITEKINEPDNVVSINEARNEITVDRNTNFINNGICKFIDTESGEAFVTNVYSVEGNVLTVIDAIPSYLVNPGHNIVCNTECKTFKVEDASNFAVGDIVALKDNKKSSFFWSRNYQEGDFVKILKIDNNVITTANPILGNYKNEGCLTACKVDMIDCIINDIHFNQIDCSSTPLKTFGFKAELVTGQFNNVSVTGFEYNLCVDSCWNVGINHCTAENAEASYADDGYALHLYDCQNVSIVGGTFVGENHGIAILAHYEGMYNVINRNIIIDGCEASTTLAIRNQNSIDSHDCSDLITIENCCVAGIYVGGKRWTIKNNKIATDLNLTPTNNWGHNISDNIIGGRLYIHKDNSTSYDRETGNTHYVQENEYTVINNNVFGNELFIDINHNSQDTTLVDVRKINIIITNNITYRGIRCFLANISNAGNTDSYTNINGGGTLIIRDNYFYHCYITFIKCKNLTLINNVFQSDYNAASDYIKLFAVNATIDRNTISNNNTPALEEPSKCIAVSTVNAVITNNKSNLFDIVKLNNIPNGVVCKYSIENNKIYGLTNYANYWLRIGANLYELFVRNNFIESVYQYYIVQSGTRSEDSICRLGQNNNVAGLLCNWNGQDSYNIIGTTKIENLVVRYWSGIRWTTTMGQSALLATRGTTAERPTGYGMQLGFQFYDESLQIPVYAASISYDHVTWKDSNGAVKHRVDFTSTTAKIESMTCSDGTYTIVIAPNNGYTLPSSLDYDAEHNPDNYVKRSMPTTYLSSSTDFTYEAIGSGKYRLVIPATTIIQNIEIKVTATS